jgi:hypothetical protein
VFLSGNIDYFGYFIETEKRNLYMSFIVDSIGPAFSLFPLYISICFLVEARETLRFPHESSKQIWQTVGFFAASAIFFTIAVLLSLCWQTNVDESLASLKISVSEELNSFGQPPG